MEFVSCFGFRTSNLFLVPFSDFLYVLRFWFVYFILGLIALPLTAKIFSRFVDKGYIFSKTIGVLLVSFLIWIAASFKILQFSLASLLIIVGLISFLSLIYLLSYCSIVKPARHLLSQKATAGGLLNCLRENKKTIILISFEEVMFFLCLLLWSYVRGFQPTIEGLEKYMDFGFINAILKSQYFPPHDMWLSGYTINYYYFGHLIAAVLTLLSKIPPEVIYNLMIAMTFATCFTFSFSLGLNLFWQIFSKMKNTTKRFVLLPLLAGFLTAYLVTNAANLQPAYHLLTKGASTYWYPDATRFIVKKFGAFDETIHEFPHYSFVVADLHGHVSDIPTVLILIGFIFVLFLKINEKRYSEGSPHDTASVKTRGSFAIRFDSWLRTMPLTVFDALFLGFLLSCAYMTNAMDGPVYLALAGLTVFGTYLFVGSNHFRDLRKIVTNAILKSAIFFFFAGLVFVSCSFPFLKSFKNFTGGITPVDFRSPLWMLGVLWGFQFFMFFSFFIFLFFRKIGKREVLAKTFAGFFGVKVKVLNENSSAESNFQASDLFIIFLFIASFFLIVFPEIFYVKDIYIHEYQRANTMFKMTYQAFILLYISVPYIFFRIFQHVKDNLKKIFLFPVIIFFALAILGLFAVSIYPSYAINAYYGLKNYIGLDGLKYLQSLYPDDYKLINWLKSSEGQKLRSKNSQILRPQLEFDSKNTIWPKPQSENFLPVILEGVGDSYTKYARISANTGFPTVLGWPVHEWLWRNSYKADGTSTGYDLPGRRTADVLKIYESVDLNETKNLLKEYQVDYVWVGQLEREKYKNLNEKKFLQLGKVFLKFGNSTLYKVQS